MTRYRYPGLAMLVFLVPHGLSAGELWKPELHSSWQWQLSGDLDLSIDAAIYDVDLFESPAGVVESLHARHRRVVCYFSAGSWEEGRPDGERFPETVRGKKLKGWPRERWLDIRKLDVLGPLLEARLDICKQKGFDGVEPDNVDGYQNDTGFPLTAADQLRFNQFLASAAHARGLSVALKNDLDQVGDLVPYFDWALNEQCFQYKECDKLAPFIQAGKAVFNVEYKLRTDQFCPRARELNFNSMRKHVKLDAYLEPCR